MKLHEELSEILGEYIPENKIDESFRRRDKEGSLDIKTLWKIILLILRRLHELEKRTK